MTTQAVTDLHLRHPLKQRRYWLPLAIVVFAVQIPFLHHYFRGAREVTQGIPYQDTFDRASLGDDWWSAGGAWRIVDGHLYSPGVGHNPLWLKARLPDDARISFDAWNDGSSADIEVEAWGDGRNHGTGYMFMMGIARNTESRIAKLEERAPTLDDLRAQLAQRARPFPIRTPGIEGVWESATQPFDVWSAQHDLDKLAKGVLLDKDTPIAMRRVGEPRVVRGQHYHFVISKKAGQIRWDVDGQQLLILNDPAPLGGGEGVFHSGHDRFGFSSWNNDTYFDNLQIEGI